MLLTHALACSASQFVHNKKSPLIYTSMHSGGFDLTKLTYTRLEDNLICHRSDQHTGTINATPGLYKLRCCWITNNVPPAQVSPAIYSSAAQRSAMRCRALPFVCGAVRSFAHTAAVVVVVVVVLIVVAPGMIQVPRFCTCCVLVFSLSLVDCPLSVPMPPPPRKYHTYCRSERDINKHTAQRRAISSAQAPTSWYYYQFAIRTK